MRIGFNSVLSVSLYFTVDYYIVCNPFVLIYSFISLNRHSTEFSKTTLKHGGLY